MDLQLLKVANQAALDKKASEICFLNVAGKSDLCQYQMICSAMNEKQAVAIADGIEQLCRMHLRVFPFAVEGKATGTWILMDYGSTLVHIFLESQRRHYDLESLWPQSEVALP